MKTVVVDLELNQPSNKIIQIGAVCIDTKSHKLISIFNQICNPEGELPSQYITNLTKITPEMVKNAEPLSDVLVQFWSFQLF